jgi:hypothetical protein
MRSIPSVVVSVLLAMSSSAAFAKAAPGVASVAPLPRASLLADSVVVTPQSQPAPQPVAPAAVPVAAAPVAAAPVVEEPAHRTTAVVHEDTPHNYMSTIAVSAIMGAVLGALVGGSIYYLGSQDHAARIGYWAAGGVRVGTAVGLTQVVVQENRADAAVASGSNLPTDPAPTYRLALLNLSF